MVGYASVLLILNKLEGDNLVFLIFPLQKIYVGTIGFA